MSIVADIPDSWRSSNGQILDSFLGTLHVLVFQEDEWPSKIFGYIIESRRGHFQLFTRFLPLLIVIIPVVGNV